MKIFNQRLKDVRPDVNLAEYLTAFVRKEDYVDKKVVELAIATNFRL